MEDLLTCINWAILQINNKWPITLQWTWEFPELNLTGTIKMIAVNCSVGSHKIQKECGGWNKLGH
jgi:hypothetical protein